MLKIVCYNCVLKMQICGYKMFSTTMKNYGGLSNPLKFLMIISSLAIELMATPNGNPTNDL